MAPVARELSSFGGVLEPLQTAVTLKGRSGNFERLWKSIKGFQVHFAGKIRASALD